MTPSKQIEELIGRLTSKDKIVLHTLDEAYGEYDGGAFFSFDAITQRTKLNRREVRLSCRRLKRKGLAEFGKGLWNDEGPAGSGYAVTSQAHKILRAHLAILKEEA